MKPTLRLRRGAGRHAARLRAAVMAVASSAAAAAAGVAAGAGTPVQWTNPAGGNFADAANWNNGAGPVPGGGHDASFGVSGIYTTTLSSDANTAGISVVGSNVTLSPAGGARTWQTPELRALTGTLTLGAAAAFPPPPPAGPASSLTINAFNSAKISAGGALVVAAGNDLVAGNVSVAYDSGSAGGVGTLSVDGAGSSLTTNAMLFAAHQGGAASLSFTNDAFAKFGGLTTDGGTNPFTDATLTVASGADASFAGYFNWGFLGTHANQTFDLTITGAGSTLVQSQGFFHVGAGIAGAASKSTLIVTNGGELVTSDGSYSMLIKPTGTVDFTGGTVRFRGDISVEGGTLKRSDAAGVFDWTDTRTRNLSIGGGGKVDLAGAVTFAHPSTGSLQTSVGVAGTNSKLITGGLLTVHGKATVNVTANGQLAPASLALTGDTSGVAGRVTIDGAGASLVVAGNTTVGGAASAGRLELLNNASATFAGNLSVISGGSTSIPAMSVQSGADAVAQADVTLGAGSFGPTFTVTGAGSTFTQTGAGSFVIGNAAGISSSTWVRIETGGVVSTGTGTLTLHSGGNLSTHNNGTLNVNGNIVINGGGNLGGFNWQPGKSLTQTQGSVDGFHVDMLNLSGNTINTGGNFALFTVGKLALKGNSTMTLHSGARGMVKSLALGADGTGATLSLDNARFESVWALPTTIGAATGAPATVGVGANALFNVTGFGTLAVKATGRINVNGGTVRAEATAIDGGAITLDAGAALVTGADLAITNGGKIDLKANRMAVRSGDVGSWDGAGYTGVTGLVQRGRNGGAWDGAGLTTSLADADGPAPLTALGVAPAGDVGLAGATYGGVTLAASDVIVKYTYAGDANLDGRINGDDYFAIDFNVNSPGAHGWARGDFDYNGKVNGDDYFILDANVGRQSLGVLAAPPTGVADAATVPEPAGLASLALCGHLVARRRRRVRLIRA
ncbi:MAG TPA: hypothetical protein VER17_09000 [Tepidisphaeraceae bacterium]|nr:hypothetical protein [Tepidisphaeraceae bacterium]